MPFFEEQPTSVPRKPRALAHGEGLVYPPPRSKLETPPVDAVRGLVLLSGYKWILEQGHGERYRDLLPVGRFRDRVSTVTAAEWVPIEDALVVYAACDGLRLSFEEQVAIGRAVSSANNGLFVTTVARLVGKVASPWTALAHLEKAWQRSNRGGAVAVYKLGERQARLEFWRVPLARSPFFTTSMRGAIAVGIEPFCARVVVNDIPEMMTEDGFALRVTW
ncbi:MAG: hypothetical protein JWP97_6812 [Labilithrix sp.]|nr:hypothetical protein [Labilithrix sp.]